MTFKSTIIHTRGKIPVLTLWAGSFKRAAKGMSRCQAQGSLARRLSLVREDIFLKGLCMVFKAPRGPRCSEHN